MAEGGPLDTNVKDMIRHIVELPRKEEDMALGAAEVVSKSKEDIVKMDDTDGKLPVAS
jgi:hypothetical protein